jgi:hemoglobin-like flavoprotein
MSNLKSISEIDFFKTIPYLKLNSTCAIGCPINGNGISKFYHNFIHIFPRFDSIFNFKQFKAIHQEQNLLKSVGGILDFFQTSENHVDIHKLIKILSSEAFPQLNKSTLYYSCAPS